jgi:hypothetical protein
MSRPLTGTKRQTGDGWQVSVPLHRGAAARQTWTFRTEDAADRWLRAAVAAITAGQPLPTPAPEHLAPRAARRAAAPAGTRFLDMAMPWLHERYEDIRMGGLDRMGKVEGHIQRIDGWMVERELTLEKMVREEVKQLQASLTRAAPSTFRASVPEGLNPDALLTLDEALALPEKPASRSTLKRRIEQGLLVPAEKSTTPYRYRVADLFSEAVLRTSEGGLRRGPRTQGVLSQPVAKDVKWIFEQVCLFAQDHGVAVPQDRKSLPMHRSDKAPRPKRQPVSYVQCADIAGRLHVVHQLALWLMRVLGLRISESYGIRVRNLTDNGPGRPGFVCIAGQGGRGFKWRTAEGRHETRHHVDALKNTNSYRVLVVPSMLMDLLRVIIAVFHTDETGAVRQDARLIPGLQERDRAGQGSFRAALAKAAAATGIDCSREEDELDEIFSCTPHDMRRSVLTDLDRLEMKKTHIKRFAGHAAGEDVLEAHYLLDDPQLRPMRKIAEQIQNELDREVPAGLMVATLVRCTTGNQEHLAADAARIDAELAERDWLVVPDADGDPLLNADQVAQELGITVQVARRWMGDGRVPSLHWADRARGAERRSRLSEVYAVRDRRQSQLTLREIADEVNQPYHTIYQFVIAQGITLVPHGQRGYVVPDAVAATLRSHYARQDELHRRAVPLSVAVSELNTCKAVVDRLIADGVLVEDDRTHDNRRMVTRASVEAAQSQRSRASRRSPGRRTDLISWAEARAATGLSDARLDSLVAVGTLERVEHQRRRHLSKASLLRYFAEHAPERLTIGLPEGA